MEILRFSHSKLLLRAASAAFASATFVFIYVYPDWAGIELWTVILAYGIGHSIVAPGCAAFFALLCWRYASRAFGSLTAVEATDSGLKVATFWGWTSIAWRDLIDVKLETVARKRRIQHRLLLRIASNGLTETKNLRLQLNLVDLPKGKFAGLAGQIEHLRDNAIAGRPPEQGTYAAHGTEAHVPSLARAGEASNDSSGDFDADAAFARYMARKAATAEAVAASAPSPTPPPPAVPPRPAFGRKGI